MRPPRLAVHADHALLATSDGRLHVRDGITVVVEDGRIVDIGTEEVTEAEHVRVPAGGLLTAGFVDAHTHSLNGPLFRATTEDRPRGGDSSLVYDFLMPIGDLASRLLTPEEAVAVYTTALARILAGGTTTVLDVFRPDTPALIEAAREVGIRTFAAPYVASATVTGLDRDGDPRTVPRDEDAEVATALRLFADHDEGAQGRIRVAFGPHCTDTCSVELLRRLQREAKDRDTLLTIHAAQSRTEVRVMQRRFGVTPIRHLVDHGICGPGVVVAHAVFATDDDLALLADTGTAVASCPATFAQGGHHVDYRRFASAGVTVGIGTDGYSATFTEELRTAGILSKLSAGRADASTALDLLTAGTRGGARVLGHDDLGALRVGARADLVGFGFDEDAAGPVLDPVRSLVWQPHGARADLVVVDGQILVRDGRHQRVDVVGAARRSSAAVERVWREAWLRLGIRPSGP